MINRAFARGRVSANGAANYRAGQPLDNEQLQRYAPSIFADTAHASRSARFIPIPTITVLDALRREGFEPFSVTQSGTRREGARDFTRHAVRLRHPSAPAVRKLGDVTPEISISNANDGTAAYRISAGLFRLVCLNGMTVDDATIEGARIAHKGRADQVVADVVRESFRVISEVTRAVDAAGAWSGVSMSEPQQLAFAREAMAVRWPDPEAPAPIEPAAILRPRRPLDALPDVWHVFNRVQEGVIKGGQHYTGKAPSPHQRAPQRHVRPVLSIDDDRRINQQLWAMADATAQALTAR